MSICPMCLKKVKAKSPYTKKVKGVWVHTKHKKQKVK